MERTIVERTPAAQATLAVFRWLLLLPAVFAAWVLAVVCGYLLLSYVESLCPPELMVSGMCTADWFPRASTAVFCFSAGLAAALIVLATALVAPAHKLRAIWIAYAVGAALACLLALEGRSWPELASALGAGALAATMASAFVARAGRSSA